MITVKGGAGGTLVGSHYRRLCITILMLLLGLLVLLAVAEYAILRDQAVLLLAEQHGIQTISAYAQTNPSENDGPSIISGQNNANAIDDNPPAMVISYTGLLLLIAWQLVPYALIAIALLATLGYFFYVLQRKFIAPALCLVDYLQQACHQEEPMPPSLPIMWQPAMDIIAKCFASHRHALQKLQADEAFKRAVVDNSMLAVISMNQQGVITEFNRAAEQVFGYQAAHIIGQDLADRIIPERYRAAHRAGLLRYLLTGQTRAIGINLELSALHADGHEFPVELTIFVTPVEQNLSYTAFVADHTQRKQAEEQVAQQREALLQSEKLSAMGALLAGVAHELNNPLAILMGRAALLEDKTKNSDLQADAERIRIAADRCGRIVKTFLAMARQKPVERKWSSLNDVATGAADLLNYNLRSDGISLILELDAKLPAVEMDADKIGQVLVNLIVNAQQALSAITTTRKICLKTGGAENYQYLQVIDNGLGVPEALKERIFEPFFTTKKEGMGTGIGLSVSRAILREHGGELSLDNSQNGAIFKISLPVKERGGWVRFERLDDRLSYSQHEGRVLIVDDEHEVASVLADILRSAGYEVHIASSGNAALAWLAINPCDLLFSDVRMPDMDGITLWRKLKERHPELVKHMALITGDTLSASIAPLIAETGLPHLEKPFLPEEVLQLAARIETD